MNQVNAKIADVTIKSPTSNKDLRFNRIHKLKFNKKSQEYHAIIYLFNSNFMYEVIHPMFKRTFYGGPIQVHGRSIFDADCRLQDVQNVSKYVHPVWTPHGRLLGTLSPMPSRRFHKLVGPYLDVLWAYTEGD